MSNANDRQAYNHPERKMTVCPLTEDQAREEAAKLRLKIAAPDINPYEREGLANEIAAMVASYHGIDERLEELTTPDKGVTRSEAYWFEYTALIKAQNDRQITAYFANTAPAIAISQMQGGAYLGSPIDLLELKEQVQQQMKDLATSGASREDRIATLIILTQKAGEAIMADLPKAKSVEARAVMLKQAANTFRTAGSLTEKLHKLNQAPGNIYDSEKVKQHNQFLEKHDADRSNLSKLVTREKSQTRNSDTPVEAVGARTRSKDNSR